MKRTVPPGLISVLVLMTGACAQGDRTESGGTQSDGNVVEVVARGLTLEAPDEIPSGWTTFRFRNESAMVHFAVVQRLPEGFGIEEHQALVAPIFQEGMNLLNAGDGEAALLKFGELPESFGQIVFMGGPGFTGAGRTSQASVYLEPGTYLLECYVKTAGIFHSYNPDPSMYGMVHEFTVTEEASEAPEPTATVEITISGEHGMRVEGDLVPGEHTVAVHFVDQTVHEHFLGHDVHLVRLSADADLDGLAAWMDWRQPMGLETPAPAEFVGGTNEMPAGGIAYFTVALETGRYAWIAEVPNPDGKGMLKAFTVP